MNFAQQQSIDDASGPSSFAISFPPVFWLFKQRANIMKLLTFGALALSLASLSMASVTCVEVGSTQTATWTNAEGQSCTWTGVVGSNFGETALGSE